MNNKMNNPESKSVAIIGGGVIGMSTAFHLAEKGVSKITVIDKGNIGGGSSLQAAGIVTSLEWNETAIRARLKTLDNFERFSQILDGYFFHDTQKRLRSFRITACLPELGETKRTCLLIYLVF